MIGHNDPIGASPLTPSQSASNIAGIISACVAIKSTLKSIVCAPVNATTPWDVNNADYDAIEAALPAALSGIPGVTLMTPRPTFVPEDYLDGEHFNLSGCQKYADFIEPYIVVAGF